MAEAPSGGRRRRASYLGLALVIVLSLAGILALTRPAAAPAAKLAPAFSLPGPDGATVAEASRPGRPSVITFWASWCTSCRTDLPVLADQARRAGVRLVMVNEFETAATATAFLSELGVTGTLALDQAGEVAGEYEVIGLPTTVFVQADGTIARRMVGAMSAAQISAALQAASPAPA